MAANSSDSSNLTQISARVDERKGRLLVDVHGDVTNTEAPVLRRELASIIEQSDDSQWRAVYLDIRTARMIDCTGVNWLYAETIRLRDAGKQVVIRISSPAINRVLFFVGIEKLATIKYRRRKQTR